MNKEEILKKAAELVSTKRESSHGDAFKNHSQIADYGVCSLMTN